MALYAFKLTNPDVETLENLAKELSHRTGRAASRSAALRALIRLAQTYDGAVLDRLADIVVEECTARVHRGRES